jgi:hypothetical protein
MWLMKLRVNTRHPRHALRHSPTLPSAATISANSPQHYTHGHNEAALLLPRPAGITPLPSSSAAPLTAPDHLARALQHPRRPPTQQHLRPDQPNLPPKIPPHKPDLKAPLRNRQRFPVPPDLLYAGDLTHTQQLHLQAPQAPAHTPPYLRGTARRRPRAKAHV